MNYDKVQALVRQLLMEVGEDPDREGLKKTPQRVTKTLEFLTKGYGQNLDEVINHAVFSSGSNNMVLVRDIEVYSLCEHHLLPFFGRCHIGYIARGRVLGVSKLARIVDLYARRLQIQENLTGEIARAVMEAASPEGVGVVMECRHMCMMMRGVAKQNSVMTTSSLLGTFRKSSATRMEFLNLIRRDAV
jgi:GTP cyclohydrolase I